MQAHENSPNEEGELFRHYDRRHYLPVIYGLGITAFLLTVFGIICVGVALST